LFGSCWIMTGIESWRSPFGVGGMALQVKLSLYSSGIHGASSQLLTAISVAWLSLCKLLGWTSHAAASVASAKVQESISCADEAVAASAVCLMPVFCLAQQAQHVGAVHQQQVQQQQQQQPAAVWKLQQPPQQLVDVFLHRLQGLADCAASSPAVRLASIRSLIQLLQLCVDCSTGSLQAGLLGGWLQHSVQTALDLYHISTFQTASIDATAAAVDAQSSDQMLHIISCSHLGYATALSWRQQQGDSTMKSSDSSGTSCAACVLPPFKDLLPLLQTVLAVSGSGSITDPSAATIKTVQGQLQVAALQLIVFYLNVAHTATPPVAVAGSQKLLLDAVNLVAAPCNAVSSAALQLLQVCLQPAVLQEMFGQQLQQPLHAHSAKPAANDGKEHMPGAESAATAAASPRLLLEHLKSLLVKLDSKVTGHPQLAVPERVIMSKVALMRAIASLYQPLMDSDCVELPLLLLLEQIASDHAQVGRQTDGATRGICAAAPSNKPLLSVIGSHPSLIGEHLTLVYENVQIALPLISYAYMHVENE
jgi:hypothetical protein